jgi:hypothetical protein
MLDETADELLERMTRLQERMTRIKGGPSSLRDLEYLRGYLWLKEGWGEEVARRLRRDSERNEIEATEAFEEIATQAIYGVFDLFTPYIQAQFTGRPSTAATTKGEHEEKSG